MIIVTVYPTEKDREHCTNAVSTIQVCTQRDMEKVCKVYPEMFLGYSNGSGSKLNYADAVTALSNSNSNCYKYNTQGNGYEC